MFMTTYLMLLGKNAHILIQSVAVNGFMVHLPRTFSTIIVLTKQHSEEINFILQTTDWKKTPN